MAWRSGVYLATGSPVAVSPAWSFADDPPGGDRVEAITITRGRRDEHERTGVGTATVLMNTTAEWAADALDKTHVRIDLVNPVLDVAQTIYRGFVDEASWEIDPSEQVARLELSCVDALDYLGGYELGPATAGHPATPLRPPDSEGDIYYLGGPVAIVNCDDRIRAALGDASWPAGLSEIFSGNVRVKETVYPPRTAALEVIQDAADAEFPGVSNVYVSKDGVVTFHGRKARFNPDVAEYDIDEWNVGDGAAIEANPTTTAQLRGLSFVRSRALLINAALATPQDIADKDIPGQIVSDLTSIDAHGLRSWSAENLLTDGHAGGTTTDLVETRKFATYYVDNYKTPYDRITNLVLQALHPNDPRAPYTWRVLSEIEISDLVHVSTSHPGAGGGITGAFFVEGIRYEIRPATPEFDLVTMSLDVSPQALYTSNPFGD